MHRIKNYQLYILLSSFLLLTAFSVSAQEQGLNLKVSPEKLNLKVGEKVQLNAKVIDENGKEVESTLRFFARGRSPKGSVASADSTGTVTANFPGEGSVIVLMPHPDGKFLRVDVPLNVAFPPISKIAFVDVPKEVFTGSLTAINAMVWDQMDFERADVAVSYKSSNQEVAAFDDFNNLQAIKAGKVKLMATADGLETSVEISIKTNPVASLELALSETSVRSGDVVQLTPTLKDAKGNVVKNVPVSYTYTGQSSDVMEFASGMMTDDGRFVAYQAGVYRLTASCGTASAQKIIKVSSRADEIKRKIELTGRGEVHDKHTSDLWVWEGVDGRDYAVTGTWGADGEAYFWDVTDPTKIEIIDTIKVDARTVNDVKVSEDGRVCVISREGASNRKNGIIIIDVTNPRESYIISEFSEGLTGGVHNVFIYENHVYALSNGERYDIINIEDPASPYKVGSFELDAPGHAIHDVWVVDGLAYSSNWQNGIQIVDVGNGVAGGSPSNPVKVANYAYPSGWNHAAFPYFDKKTGKTYVIGGDEAFPNGLYVKDKPTIPAGWLHFIDFTDPKNPKEVAKYEVPGAGSHNFWVEGDMLYVGNYNAGLRVVDLSGDLLGDLYKQGRDIGWFLPTDPKGAVPNAPMTWGPQPHKGHIFFSDWNTGLWSVKMEEKKQEN
ncbi:MAG: Ig-like domain-containing protein [Saprospiraceae bacterium]